MTPSRRSSRSGRGSGADRSRREAPEDGRPPRESERGPYQKRGDQTKLWLAISGAAVLFLIVLVVAFSGGGKAPPPVRKKAKPVKRFAQRTRDWYQVGFNCGVDWKTRTRDRHKNYTRAKIEELADLYTSNYYNKGIREQGGEKDFIRGFTRAVLGK